MRILQQSLFIPVSLLAIAIGCQQEPTSSTTDKNGSGAKQPADSAAKDYPIHGKVVAVSPDRDSVTIDHQDIPGLMKAMEMKFQVKQPEVLEGIQAGSTVQGQLTVDGGDYVITRLQANEKE